MAHQACRAPASDPSRYGVVVVLNKDGTIDRLVEKPKEPIVPRLTCVGYV